MRFLHTLFHLVTFFTVIQAFALPAAFSSYVESGSELYKRKGGGGGRGGGSTSSGSRGSSGSSGSLSSSGSSGSRGGSSGGSAFGTASPRTFGGGSRFGGGAATPYRNNAASRSSWPGPTPFLLGAGALALFPGLWLYGAYSYPYSHQNRNNEDEDQNNGTAGTRTYLNETTGQNETRPVQCLCAQYEQCSCEDSTDQAYLNEVANDEEISTVRNGTLYINGTLENDTATESSSSAAAGSLEQRLVEATGYWPIIAGVAYTLWFL